MAVAFEVPAPSIEMEWNRFVGQFGVEKVREFVWAIPEDLSLESIGFIFRKLEAQGFHLLATVDGLIYLRDHPI